MAVVEATPQRAVFHWINVTGERRLRFNYRVNLRFDRANASPVVAVPVRGTWGDSSRPDWERNGLEKWGGWNHCNEISATPAVSFYGVLPEGRSRCALFHRADCYWLIDVDRFFPSRRFRLRYLIVWEAYARYCLWTCARLCARWRSTSKSHVCAFSSQWS